MNFSLDAVAAATDGTVRGPAATVAGATIDSRAVEHGQLFVPIVAERDGHDFIDNALMAGAAAYLTDRDDERETAAVRVHDTGEALIALGRAARDRTGDRVVGITGSVGKTSTKDMLAAVLATTYRSAANRASFNNELGVPLTLVNAPDDVEAVVCEMGARGIGHIATLCAIARPTIGVVTAVTGAHLEKFGSIDGVAKAKSELVQALPSSGFAILNADQDRVAAMAACTDATVVRVGTAGPSLTIRADDITVGDDLRSAFTLVSDWGSATVHLGVRGAHQVTNALCAAGAALATGVTLDDVVAGLSGAVASPMRMDLKRRNDGLIVLDDSYNANPTSMFAALDALAALTVKRRIAVLGVMAELGDDEAQGHRRVADHAAASGVELLAVATDLYGPGVEVVADVAAAVYALGERHVGDGDAVLVKASRVAALERVAMAILDGTASQG